MIIKSPIEDLIVLPKSVFGSLKGATADELKVLIYLFGCPDCPLVDVARETGVTLASVESAVAFWRGAGVFVEAETPKKRVATDTSAYRNYDSQTISEKMSKDSEYAMVCRVATEQLEKSQLTKNDLSSLLYLYDFVGIPAPVICGIIQMCCEIGKKNLQYIFKKALAMYEDGIDSYDKFESYLARRQAINSNIGKLRKLCGIGERALTPREQKMFDTWFGEWNFSFEMVELAYNKTVDNTGKVTVTYMNAILRSWREEGFATPEDVAKGEGSRNTNIESSFEGDEFIAAALKRGFDDN